MLILIYLLYILISIYRWREKGGEGNTFQISTRAKRPPLTSKHADAQTGLLVHPFPDGVQFMMAGCVDAVELFGAGEGHEEDVRGWECQFGVLGGWRGCLERHSFSFLFILFSSRIEKLIECFFVKLMVEE